MPCRPSSICETILGFSSTRGFILPILFLSRNGKTAYDKQHWLEAVDHFEDALRLYLSALDRCQLLCQDQLVVNLSRNLNPQKRAKFMEYNFVPDSVEFYPLLETLVREVLRCRLGCHDEVAMVNGERMEEGFLNQHFHYLQFCYYKCEWAGLMSVVAIPLNCQVQVPSRGSVCSSPFTAENPRSMPFIYKAHTLIDT